MRRGEVDRKPSHIESVKQLEELMHSLMQKSERLGMDERTSPSWDGSGVTHQCSSGSYSF